MIRELYDHGMSISEISRRLNIDRKTARKYAKSKEFPRLKERKKNILASERIGEKKWENT